MGKRTIISTLSSALWSKNTVNKTKKLIFKSLLQNVMLYGADAQTLGRHELNKIIAREMDFGRGQQGN